MSQSIIMKVLKIFLLILFLSGKSISVYAHPMPNSVVVLNIHEKHYSGQIQLPLSELQTAIGMSVNDKSERLIERLGDSLRLYFMQHIRPKSFEGKLWTVTLGNMKVIETKSQLTGNYKELVIDFEMSPPQNYDLRNFYFDYDVILHQVASHKTLIAVKQDWQQGIVSEDDSTMQQVGVIEWDIRSNTLKPFQISLQAGSNWAGFKNMVSLGISHIWEGIDHILFILTLLLPAMLLAEKKRWTALSWTAFSWTEFIGIKSSLKNLLKIVTAFTIGHSLTLFLGSVQWLNLPTQPIEILIAITIFISAFHAFRPIYPKKEVLIAGGFGLIHGLAFAETLTNLELNTKQMFLSILGFNIGIELMQLMIILLVFPILILLSKTRYYPQIRQIGAIIMMILAFAWMVERIQEKSNFITEWIA
jgi:HupE / UreJ protein